MKTGLLMGLMGVAAMALPAAPAMAQTSLGAGVLEIFGNDKCPTNANGEEIVVCKRLDERERYRIPDNLRTIAPSPENVSWAQRQRDVLQVGDTGIGSCSTVGPGGQTGCFAKAAAAQRAERKALDAAQDVPLP